MAKLTSNQGSGLKGEEKMRFLAIFLALWILNGCETANKGVKKQDNPVSEVDPSVGNIRVAIVGRHKKNNLLLVNQSNRQYLFPKDFAKDADRNKLPLQALEYRAAHLSFHDTTAITIVEDKVMEKLMSLLQEYRFYEYAQSLPAQDIGKPDWPERDSILLEHNNTLHVLTREEKLVDSTKRATKQGETYRIAKGLIRQAEATGYRPLQILQNIDGKNLFKENQQNLERDIQSLQKKKN
jgi:hypothetical protein